MRDKIIIHHSATKDGEAKDFNAFRRYHISKGWGDIGYQYVIENHNGEMVTFKGRGENKNGAHTKGQNENTGVCFAGNFDVTVPSDEMLLEGARLIVEIRSRQGKLPLEPHSKYSSKSCPGSKFPMGKLIAMVENLEAEAEKEPKKEVEMWKYDLVAWGMSNGYLKLPHMPNENAEIWTVLAITKHRDEIVDEKLKQLRMEMED